MLSSSLQQLFKPTSIAVIGASNEPGTPGYVVMRNLAKSNFLGPVMPIHPEQLPIHDLESYRSVDTLPLTPDLALICEPPEKVPDLIQELGKRGTTAVVLLSRGGFRESQEKRRQINNTLLKRPSHTVSVSSAPIAWGSSIRWWASTPAWPTGDASPGKLAFISQSDALFASVLDWAASKHIGFSYFISLGDRCDLNLSHVLDYLNRDPQYAGGVAVHRKREQGAQFSFRGQGSVAQQAHPGHQGRAFGRGRTGGGHAFVRLSRRG